MAAARIQGDMQTDQGLHLLNKARQYVPLVAGVEAAGQETDAAVAEGAAQEPAAAQAMEEGGRAASKPSSKSSGKSEGSVARKMLRLAGVSPAAAVALARLSISLVVLQSYPVEWVVACLAEEKVTLGPRESQQLAAVIAPRGNRNLSPSAQASSEQAQPVPATWERPEPKPWYFVKCANASCDCL